jgi:hypothetical protein
MLFATPVFSFRHFSRHYAIDYFSAIDAFATAALLLSISSHFAVSLAISILRHNIFFCHRRRIRRHRRWPEADYHSHYWLMLIIFRLLAIQAG